MAERLALVVGAASGPGLRAGKNDASDVWSLLNDPELGGAQKSSSQFHPVCTRQQFNDSLEIMLADWRTDDQLIIYFSGHGANSNGVFSLMFFRTESARYERLLFRNLLNEIEAAGVHRCLVIVDACFSGAIAKGETSAVDDEELTIQLPEGIAMVAATSSRQIAVELDDGTNSVFTALLIEAVRSGLWGASTDRLIYLPELVEAINFRAKETHLSQTATFTLRQASSDIWISKNPLWKGGDDGHQGAEVTLPVASGAVDSLAAAELFYRNNPASRHPCDGPTYLDLDWSLVQDFARSFDPTLDCRTPSEDVAEKLGFYSLAPVGQRRLHRAAVLCFAKRPDLYIPQATSKVVHGEVSSESLSISPVRGPLSEQIRTLLDQTVSLTRERVEFQLDGTRVDYHGIPVEVLREAISNAVAHRDYQKPGEVRVAVSRDKVVISNPGRLGAASSFEELLARPISSPVDVSIVTYLNHLSDVEGINRGCATFKKYRSARGDAAITGSEDHGESFSLTISLRNPKDDVERDLRSRRNVSLEDSLHPVPEAEIDFAHRFMTSRHQLKRDANFIGAFILNAALLLSVIWLEPFRPGEFLAFALGSAGVTMLCILIYFQERYRRLIGQLISDIAGRELEVPFRTMRRREFEKRAAFLVMVIGTPVQIVYLTFESTSSQMSPLYMFYMVAIVLNLLEASLSIVRMALTALGVIVAIAFTPGVIIDGRAFDAVNGSHSPLSWAFVALLSSIVVSTAVRLQRLTQDADRIATSLL